MKIIVPSQTDIKNLKQLMRGFNNGFSGESVLWRSDPHLYAHIYEIEDIDIDTFWDGIGHPKDSTSSYDDVIIAKERYIRLDIRKIKLGWFKTHWMCDVNITYDNYVVSLGILPLHNTLADIVEIIHNGFDLMISPELLQPSEFRKRYKLEHYEQN